MAESRRGLGSALVLLSLLLAGACWFDVGSAGKTHRVCHVQRSRKCFQLVAHRAVTDDGQRCGWMVLAQFTECAEQEIDTLAFGEEPDEKKGGRHAVVAARDSLLQGMLGRIGVRQRGCLAARRDLPGRHMEAQQVFLAALAVGEETVAQAEEEPLGQVLPFRVGLVVAGRVNEDGALLSREHAREKHHPVFNEVISRQDDQIRVRAPDLAEQALAKR